MKKCLTSCKAFLSLLSLFPRSNSFITFLAPSTTAASIRNRCLRSSILSSNGCSSSRGTSPLADKSCMEPCCFELTFCFIWNARKSFLKKSNFVQMEFVVLKNAQLQFGPLQDDLLKGKMPEQ